MAHGSWQLCRGGWRTDGSFPEANAEARGTRGPKTTLDTEHSTWIRVRMLPDYPLPGLLTPSATTLHVFEPRGAQPPTRHPAKGYIPGLGSGRLSPGDLEMHVGCYEQWTWWRSNTHTTTAGAMHWGGRGHALLLDTPSVHCSSAFVHPHTKGFTIEASPHTVKCAT